MPPAFLRVIQVEDLEPCGRSRDVGRQLVLGNDALAVTVSDLREQFHAIPLDALARIRLFSFPLRSI